MPVKYVFIAIVFFALTACAPAPNSPSMNFQFFEDVHITSNSKFVVNKFELKISGENKSYPSADIIHKTFYDKLQSHGKKVGLLSDQTNSDLFRLDIYYHYKRTFGILMQKNTIQAAGYSYDIDVFDINGNKIGNLSQSRPSRELTGLLHYADNSVKAIKGMVGIANPEVEDTYINYFVEELVNDISSLQKISEEK